MPEQNPPQQLDVGSIRRFIKAGVKLFKKELADEVVTFASGLTYAEFRQAVSRKEIPQSVSVPIFQAVEKRDMECDVIIIAFVQGATYIFQVNKDGHVEECENFATIGDGGYVAEAIMYFRKHSNQDSLRETLYHVYESMHVAA
jgi:hypothetical protein